MASIRIPDRPEAAPAAAPWPADEIAIRADELFARRLDTEFSAGVRALLHDPETGLSSLQGEAALEAVAGIYPALEELKQRTLGGAIGPRQRSLLEPLIDTRLEWAAGTIGRLAGRATAQVDDASVSERLAGLGRDAAEAWDDPAHLRTLGRAAVSELRWQGERRGWDTAETDARARGGLSDLYAGAVEAAIGRDLDGAASLLAHARDVIDPARLATVDRRLSRAREDGFLREVDAALQALPLDPSGPPDMAVRVAGLTPHDATDQVRIRLGELAAHAQRRAERQWNRRQAEAGIVALDWLRQNPDASSLFLPGEMRDWLAPDQRDALRTLEQRGHLVTDPDLFERLDRQSVYEPAAFATLDLDRHRLSLDDGDHERLAAAQKAIVEGTTDPAATRYRWARIGTDRALEGQGIDTESPEAADIRADVRGWLDDFEAIAGRPASGADIDAVVARAIGGVDAGAVVREPAEPFDPEHIVPVQAPPAGRPPSRPPPPPPTAAPRPAGPGHNQPPPPGLPTLLDKLGQGRQSSSPPSAAATPPPDTAGPAAAAGAGEKKQQPGVVGDSAEPVQTKDLTRLSIGEIEMLKRGDFDIHGEKEKGNSGPVDLFKDRAGNIYRGRQDGQGEAERLHDNIRNYR